MIALLLGWLVAAMALTTLARQRSAQVRLSQRAEGLAAVRVARHVLTRELRGRASGEIAWSLPSDSLSIRAYRGTAVACPEESRSGGLRVVVVGGMRSAQPAKDSVWVLGATGAASVLALLEARSDPGPCTVSPGQPVELWTLSARSPDRPVLALYFERGSLHLSGRALRYRRGEGGRQPLTNESLLTPESSFQPWGRGVAARLVTSGPPTWSAAVLAAGPAGIPPGG